MKTTKEEFERFEAEYRKWVKLLGRNGYDLRIHHSTPKGYQDAVATTDIDEEGKTVTVTYTRNLNKEQAYRHTPEDDARHEAVHLLVGKLVWLGEQRFISQDDISMEEETVVVVLSELLKPDKKGIENETT